MKASDFTTGGNDREKAMSNLLKTEKTDAVNTGLVEKADKSAKALKGDLYSVGKKGTHGAGSTALDAIARKRKKTSAADALDGKSRSQITGKNALTKKVQSRHNLNKSLKRGAKGVAAKAAHNALKDSELEGTDDLVATTHTGAKLAGKARKHLRSGKDALEKKDSLGALSEKKYRTEKLDKKAAQKRMQFSKYFHRNVYENAAAQAGKKKALTILSGGIKGMLSSLAGAVSQACLLPACKRTFHRHQHLVFPCILGIHLPNSFLFLRKTGARCLRPCSGTAPCRNLTILRALWHNLFRDAVK